MSVRDQNKNFKIWAKSGYIKQRCSLQPSISALIPPSEKKSLDLIMQYFIAAICWALVLFGAATVSGEESGLQVSVSKEEIRGTYAIGKNQHLEFYTKIKGEEIVSVTTFCNLTSGVRVQLTSLKLPVTAIITTVKSSTCWKKCRWMLQPQQQPLFSKRKAYRPFPTTL